MNITKINNEIYISDSASEVGNHEKIFRFVALRLRLRLRLRLLNLNLTSTST
jgi:hypothetical protein